MTVTEHLMRPGSGDIRFRSDLPTSVSEQIRKWVDEQAGGTGAHIVITPVPIDPSGITLTDLLGVALYTGTITARPSRLSLEFDGLGRWLDTYLDADVTRTAGTPTQWVGDLIRNGITAGTDATGGSNVSRTYRAHSVTAREALDNVSQIGGWEYEVRPDFTVDYGTAANLFRQVGDAGTVVVTAREEGPDGTYRGVDGGLLDQELSRLGPSIATKAVALAEGEGAAIVKGTATRTPNLDTWNGSTPTLVSVFSAPSEPSANANTAASNYLNLQTMRRQLSVSSTTSGIRRLIRPGDEAYAYQVESGLWEVANQIQFRGETIAPIVVRLLSLSWPIEPAYGVYVFNNAASPTVLDVSRWVDAEDADAWWTVGDWSPPSYGPVNRSSPEVEERVSGGPTAWTAPTLLNSWVNFGGVYTEAAYRRNGDVVELRGTIKDGATTLDTVLFTLPTGFRPPARVIFMPWSANTGRVARIDVEADGDVIAAGTPLPNAAGLSLDGISFSVTS